MPKPLPILTSKVYLNVYDLHNMNGVGYYIGLGAFHTGVEIDTENGEAIEYCYGGHPFSFSGLFEIKPKTASGVKFRQSIYMGDINMTTKELQDLVDLVADDFSGLSYHPLKKNCNTFSEEFIRRLLNKNIPGYINRLAHIGDYFSCILPKTFNFIPTAPENNNNSPNINKSYDKGPSPIIPPPNPIINRFNNNNNNINDNNKLNFYGSDNEDSDNDNNNNNDEEKRKKILDAANKRYMQQSDNSDSSSPSISSNPSNPSTPSSSNENSPSVSSPLI